MPTQDWQHRSRHTLCCRDFPTDAAPPGCRKVHYRWRRIGRRTRWTDPLTNQQTGWRKGCGHGQTRARSRERKRESERDKYMIINEFMSPHADRKTCLLELLVWRDEHARVFSSQFDRCHIQRDSVGGHTQLEAFFVGVNPEVVTPDGSVDTAPCVFDGHWSMEVRGGRTCLTSTRKQRCDPAVVNLCEMKTSDNSDPPDTEVMLVQILQRPDKCYHLFSGTQTQ